MKNQRISLPIVAIMAAAIMVGIGAWLMLDNTVQAKLICQLRPTCRWPLAKA